MMTKSVRQDFILVLLLVLLALLWPSPPAYKIVLGFGVGVGAMLGFQAGRAGQHFRKAGHGAIPCNVKYEN